MPEARPIAASALPAAPGQRRATVRQMNAALEMKAIADQIGASSSEIPSGHRRPVMMTQCPPAAPRPKIAAPPISPESAPPRSNTRNAHAEHAAETVRAASA